MQKLLDEQYVLRERDESDKRIWHLFPTEKALETYEYVIDEENRNIDICFRGFSREEQELICSLIKRMGENIEQDWLAIKGSKSE